MRLLKVRAKRQAKQAKQANSRLQVVVGLRNPGAGYEGTRHNVGSEVVGILLARSDVALGKSPSRIRALVAMVGAPDNPVLHVVPNTFMNESGQAVQAVLSYYGVEAGDSLVIHDDIDLPFGRFRVQVGGGSGGHNGIRSVERSLGTKEFSRLKIGVGRPPGSQDPADFVLRRFSKKERPDVDVMVEDAADVAEMWMNDRARAQEMAALRDRDG